MENEEEQYEEENTDRSNLQGAAVNDSAERPSEPIDSESVAEANQKLDVEEKQEKSDVSEAKDVLCCDKKSKETRQEESTAAAQMPSFETTKILLKRRRVHFDFTKRHSATQPKTTKPQRFIIQRKCFDRGEYLRTKCTRADDEDETNEASLACHMPAQ